MKNVLKVLASLFVVVFAFSVFTSCSSDDDPADNDFFAGTYNGKISYKDGATTNSTDNGSVFVTKIGSQTKYNFTFSNGIPNLNGIEFENSGNVGVSVGATELQYIRINNNTLRILYTVEGKTWTADCTR